MRWKKILIITALVILVLIVAVFTFLSLYDFNKFKPLIARTVKDATGRDLTITGNIKFELGIRPTLVVEDARFQNASWSSIPELARVKRLEVQIAVLPLIIGKFNFAHLVLVEPEVIVEFDRTGISNFSFDTAGEQADEAKIPPPPLIFSDVLIEKGRFNYKDAQSDVEFSIRIDRLEAEIPGFDQSLQLNFEGAFNDKPFTLKGTVGPIWAWVEPGYALPADFTVEAGGATARVNGEIRDPTHFKDLAFSIAAEGASTAAIAQLAGLPDIPDLGAFKLAATVQDPEGRLGIEGLDITVGSEALVAIAITGAIKNAPALQGIKLNFNARGQDAANLTRLGIPSPPRKGPFKVTADISDPETNVFSVGNLNIIFGENEITGQVNVNLAQQVPFLTAELSSQKFELGPASLDLQLTGPLEKPAIKKLDLKLGTPELAEIRLKGIVADLIELQGVDIDFQASGKDLANLKQLTGQPLPVRGAFSAAGKVFIPVHGNLEIPDLKMTIGKNNISGLLNLDVSGDKPQLGAELSSQGLDLPSVLPPELAKEGWAKGLGQIRPVKLGVQLAGFAPEIAVKKVDLQAGTLDSAEVRLTGSVKNLMTRRGIDLKFAVRGKERTKLSEIIGQPYLFAPVPGQGAYAISGSINDPTLNNYTVEDFKFVLADNELTGRVNFNLAAQPPQYEVQVSAQRFNLKPFPIPKEAAYANLNKIDNLGPLKIHSKVMIEGDHLSLPFLDLQAGSEQLAAVQVKGSIKDLTVQRGIDLQLNIQGNEVADLAKITSRSIPLQGPYALSGKLTDPAQKNFKIGNLALKLGANNITGWLDLKLKDQETTLATQLSTQRLTLQPLTITAMKPLSSIPDLGSLKLTATAVGSGKKFAVENLDLNLGKDDLMAVMLKGTIKDLMAQNGFTLEFAVRGNDLSNLKKLGGPELPLKGAFNISGQFVDPAPKVYRIPSLKVTLGDNDANGSVELNLSQKRPLVIADLSSQKIDLRPVLATTEKKSQAKEQPPHSGERKDKVFSTQPWSLDALKQIDADIKIRDKEVLLPRTALNDVMIDLLLKDGNLSIKPVKFVIGGGKADGDFNLRAQQKIPTMSLKMKIDQFDLGPMLDKLGYQRALEGTLDINTDLAGQGNSTADLMAGLNGGVFLSMNDGKADSKYLELLQRFLGTNILRLINPFEKQETYTTINCFINRVEINDGMADLKLLLDTDQTSILGAGDVNLKTEQLNLGIKPTPKKGTGISGVGSVSFSFKELSQPFRLGGTLANPSLALDPSRAAFTIGKFAGALALGPVGIAAFFADVSVGKADPCAAALKSMTQAEAKVAGESKPSDKKEDKGKKDAAEEKQKKEKESGGFFKRLFGRE